MAKEIVILTSRSYQSRPNYHCKLHKKSQNLFNCPRRVCSKCLFPLSLTHSTCSALQLKINYFLQKARASDKKNAKKIGKKTRKTSILSHSAIAVGSLSKSRRRSQLPARVHIAILPPSRTGFGACFLTVTLK